MKTSLSVLIVAQAHAADYEPFPNQNCYAGSGIEIDTEATAPEGLNVKACEQRCDADETCDCVSFRYSDGKCWKRSACWPESLDTDSSYGTYIKSSGYVTYHERSSSHTHGGIEIDTNDTAPVGFAKLDCEARCEADNDCGCVTFRPEDGKCWMRSACEPILFNTDGAFETYVKKGGPVPIPSPPAPAPAYSAADGFAMAHFESALYCGKDRFNSWNVNAQVYDVDTSKVRWIEDSKTHAVAGVGRMTSPDGCFAAVRGTDGTVQSILDAVFTTAKFDRSTCTDCRVHLGWKLSYESIQQEIFSTLEEFGCKDKPLYLTGHSLGAAVLHYLLYDALDANYTIAYATAMETPRPGNDNFAAALRGKVEASGTRAWRITHYKDVVPRLPPRGLLNYQHALPEVYFGAQEGTDFQNCGYDDADTKCNNQWKLWKLTAKDHCWYADGNPCSCSGFGSANASIVV